MRYTTFVPRRGLASTLGSLAYRIAGTVRLLCPDAGVCASFYVHALTWRFQEHESLVPGLPAEQEEEPDWQGVPAAGCRKNMRRVLSFED